MKSIWTFDGLTRCVHKFEIASHHRHRFNFYHRLLLVLVCPISVLLSSNMIFHWNLYYKFLCQLYFYFSFSIFSFRVSSKLYSNYEKFTRHSCIGWSSLCIQHSRCSAAHAWASRSIYWSSTKFRRIMVHIHGRWKTTLSTDAPLANG